MNPQPSLQKPGWIARILLTLTTITLVIVGFFFFTVALAVGAVIALVIGARLWWVLRKIKRAVREQGASEDLNGATTARTDAAVVEGEYQVVEREQIPPGSAMNHNDSNPPKNSDPSPKS